MTKSTQECYKFTPSMPVHSVKLKKQLGVIFLEKPICQLIFWFFLANWLFDKKKKGKNGLTEIQIFQQPVIGWRSRPYKYITEYDSLHFFGKLY